MRYTNHKASSERYQLPPGQLRIFSRLGGGGRDVNLKLLSVALGVDSGGKLKYHNQIAIEVRPRALDFKDRGDFTPAATQMDLS